MCLIEIIIFLIVKCNSQIYKVKCYPHEDSFFFTDLVSKQKKERCC